MPAFNEAMVGEQFERVNARLRAIEAQLSILSERAGVEYVNPSADVPEEVVELVKAGETLKAIKRYRELTGASGSEAREIVMGV
jgi:ribosomal protein L7/L12